jgi:hypothetical protein
MAYIRHEYIRLIALDESKEKKKERETEKKKSNLTPKMAHLEPLFQGVGYLLIIIVWNRG